MIFILLIALYAFATKRVVITHHLIISDARARLFGFLVLVLIFPARWLLNAIVITIVPQSWLKDPVHFALLNGIFLFVYVLSLALLCRDPHEPAPLA
jgi:hypothetical protein